MTLLAAPVTLIAGPTASGKSALALALATATGAEIINADAQQIYGDLPLLTAAPSEAERAQAPHHLFGVAKATEVWSVGHWLRATVTTLREIETRGSPAIIVGGTGLYFRALVQGLADIPPVADAARDEIEADYDREGEDAFRSALATVDPVAAARIAPGDRQRLVRALSVARTSGRSLSDWQGQTHPALTPSDWHGVVLEPDRAKLYDRCDLRLAAMVEAGVLLEVAALAARGLDPALPALKAVGFRQLAAHLLGDVPLEQALSDAQRETRRYAKRQLTWFRNQTPGWGRLTAETPEAALRQFFAQTATLTPAS
jgi:tRNA dimethylallyltransferase